MIADEFNDRFDAESVTFNNIAEESGGGDYTVKALDRSSESLLIRVKQRACINLSELFSCCGVAVLHDIPPSITREDIKFVEHLAYRLGYTEIMATVTSDHILEQLVHAGWQSIRSFTNRRTYNLIDVLMKSATL